MTTRNYVAFDLGASSGRAIVGAFDGSRLSLSECHRFANGPVDVCGRLHWNVLSMYQELLAGLRACPVQPDSMGIDTWGVDYALVSHAGALASQCVHYRDARTEGMFEAADALVGKDYIYGRTGIAFQKFNTLFQLMAMQRCGELCPGAKMLFMPDLLSWMLSGRMGCEYTIASTSQLLNAHSRTWDTEMIGRLGLPGDVFLPIEAPGTKRGMLLKDVATLVGKLSFPLIAVGGHDTASAVVSVPAERDDYVYISSGTWSLMGMLSPVPVIDARSRAWNYTNEGGADGNYRVLKNIMGLWIVQECRRHWSAQEPALDFAGLTDMARAEAGLVSLIDPDADEFFAPGDMPERVAAYCRRTGQSVPQSKGQIIRCVLDSLALKYRWGMECLVALRGKPVDTLHIVGGGSQNTLLSQLAANATGVRVLCGPVEATAVGNLMVQALALGDVCDYAQIRSVVRNSFDCIEYLPRDTARWDDAYERFLTLTGIARP